MDSIITQHQREFVTKQDNILKDALIRNGVDITDLEFIKENLYKVTELRDEFEHYYLYHDDRRTRILSMQKQPEITNNYTDNKYTITANCKYY